MHPLEEQKFKDWMMDNRYTQLSDGYWTRSKCNNGGVVTSNTIENVYELYLGHLKYMEERNNE